MWGCLEYQKASGLYAYLILSSQAFVRSRIIGNMASAFTAQKAFLNNFENVVNQRVVIQEDIKRYQETLSYASSKVNYSMGENIYMLPSDMNLSIRSGTVGYNNKILVSDSGPSLGRNNMVNASVPNKSSHRTPIVRNHAHKTSIVHAHKEVPSKHTPQPSRMKRKRSL